MTIITSGRDDPADRRDDTLSLSRISILVAFATVVWFGAAMFIRFVGPTGVFHGYKVVALYGATAVLTIALNARARKIVRLPIRRMVEVIAVTTATATMLDGVAMSVAPGLYGGDPAVIAGGGAWLLWAIGVASALALISAGRAEGGR